MEQNFEKRIATLLLKFQRKEISSDETIELQAWLNRSPGNSKFLEEILDNEGYLGKLAEDMNLEKKNLIEIERRTENFTLPAHEMNVAEFPRKLKFFSKAWLAAASLLIILTAAAYYYFNFNHGDQPVVRETAGNKRNDILPPTGANAILTLANGSQIIIDSVRNGSLTSQDNANVSKIGSNQLAYTALSEKPTKSFFNTLTTAKGGQTMVILSDGSKIWLNAASSIRFPTAFFGSERNVELTGEAYFEIKENRSMPFKVKFGGRGEVQVLGTRFNINSYEDEMVIKTTLLEGAVNVIVPFEGTEKKVRLKPGQQALVASDPNRPQQAISLMNNVDSNGVVAWKNGHFHFDNATTHTVMRELARWYDFDVNYDEHVVDQLISGDVQRNLSLSQVAEILRGLVHFTIEGKKIIVRP